MFLIGKNSLFKNVCQFTKNFKLIYTAYRHSFSRKCRPMLKKMKKSTINKAKPDLQINSNNEMIIQSKRKLDRNLEQIGKILSKKTIESNDEDYLFTFLEEINSLPLNKIDNKFFIKNFSEGLNKLKLNSQKNIIQLIKFIDKFQLTPNNIDFKSIEKKIYFQLNFFDPDSLLKTLFLYKKFSLNDFSDVLNIFKVPFERIIGQSRAESLSVIFYLFSQSNNNDISFLIKILNIIVKNLNDKIILSNECITRITNGILNKFINKFNFIHPNIWAEINDNLLKREINDWIIPSYQFYLLAKSHYSDKNLFENLEKRVYHSLIDFHFETTEKEEEKVEKLEGLVRTMCSYSISRKGSSALWMEFFIKCDNILETSIISLETINLFIEIILNKEYIYDLFKENSSFLNYVKKVISKLTSKIEELYLSENIFSINCSELNIREFCESVVKSQEFTENFTYLCMLILKKLLMTNLNSINNKY